MCVEWITGWEHLVGVGLIVFLGQMVYAGLGFGSGLITITLLVLFFGELKVFVPLLLILCLPTEILVTYENRKHIKLKERWGLLACMFPALLLGTFFLKSFNEQELLKGLGMVIALLAIYYLAFEGRFSTIPSKKVWEPLVGVLSGLLGAIYGMSGPPLIFYFKNLKLNKHQFRSLLMGIFLMMSLFRLAAYLLISVLTMQIFCLGLFCLPFALAGLWVGKKIYRKIPESMFKKITSLVLLVSGVILFLK